MAEKRPATSGSWIDRLDPAAAARVLAAMERPDAPPLDPGLPAIPGYAVSARLGGGGDGTVYAAVRLESGQPVAIKLLDRRPAGERALRRAWREVDLCRDLRLPGTPRLLDHGLHEGRPYLVTELVDGRPLLEHCAERRLDRRQRVALLAELADAVHALHELGVIHRDVKPSNVLVDERGRPTLIDLGIAVLLERDRTETITADGAPIGSPAYMAPEQARGERRNVSIRSDVYGLGATAFAVLTDQAPHDTDAPLHEAVRRVAADPARDPRLLDPSLSRPLATVLRKAVAFEPADRYESAAAFAEDLRRWLRREPVQARRPSPWQRLCRAGARHPFLTTALGCAVIAACMLVPARVAVWRLDRQPAVVEGDAHWARVRSYGGSVLREWSFEPPLAILHRSVETAPASMGGGRVLVLAVGAGEGHHDRSQVLVHDFTPSLPQRWASGTGPPDIVMPEPISVVEPGRFAVRQCFVADVFPALEGTEIVAVHGHELYSPCAIRVYALDGRILYEVWHDGKTGCLWVAEAGSLLGFGLNSENNWGGRGHGGLAYAVYPWVVFGLRPTAGEVRREWIRTPGGLGTVPAEWYGCLGPPAAVEALAEHGAWHDILRPPDYRAETGDDRCLLVVHGPGRDWITFTLDARDGEARLDGVSPYYVRERRRTDVPDPGFLRLDELPPLLIDPRFPGG